MLMARREAPIASRAAAVARLARWVLLALLGIAIGAVLGDLAAGKRLGSPSSPGGGYAGLSANPDASTTGIAASPACPDCADSYGVAVRLRAERAERESDAYRELGAVDLDWPVPRPEDEYRYGGRFPDPDPPTERSDPAANVAVTDSVPVTDPPPTD